MLKLVNFRGRAFLMSVRFRIHNLLSVLAGGGGDKVIEDEDKEMRAGVVGTMKPLKMMSGTGVSGRLYTIPKSLTKRTGAGLRMAVSRNGILHGVWRW